MYRHFLYLICILTLLGSACSGAPASDVTPETEASLTRIRLPMGYIPNVQYAPFYVAAEKGYFRQAGLEIDFDYSFETDGVALVGANELPFALVWGAGAAGACTGPAGSVCDELVAGISSGRNR